MITRREVLLGLIASPLAVSFAAPVAEPDFDPEICPEPHYLSQESALGFGLLLKNKPAVRRSIIILPAARDLTPESCSDIFRRVTAGAWLICESGLCFSSYEESVLQRRVLKEIFGVHTLPSVRVSSYVTYTWPVQELVRSFQAVTPVRCASSETIAHFTGVAVCIRRPIGLGGIIYLGSMLGPGLFAEEREAHLIGDAMLRWVGQSGGGYSDL